MFKIIKCINKFIAQMATLFLLMTAVASAGELSDQMLSRLNTVLETTLSVFPDGTPGKNEALALSAKLIEIVNLPIDGAENVQGYVGDNLIILASEAKQAYEAFESGLQNAPAEMRSLLDSVFVSTRGQITYEGTQIGVPGVPVVQTVVGGIPDQLGGTGRLVIGLSISDLQGNYTIIHPGNVIALLDGTPDLQTRVTPMFDVSSSPKIWKVSYDAQGNLSKVRVE